MNARVLSIRPGRRIRALSITLMALTLSAIALAITATPAQAIVEPLHISMGRPQSTSPSPRTSLPPGGPHFQDQTT